MLASPPVPLYLGALLYHAMWALTVPWPRDWDPAYYQTVALHIATGKGAITGSIWQLAALPDTLPYPAHLHWMPLPAWVLVPFTWLWHAHGAQVTTVLLAAMWAPIAWAHARDLNASPKVALLAGGLAGTALAHFRFTSTPDSIALYGVLGGLGLLLASRQRHGATALVVVLAALTRAEGCCLGLCLFPVLRRHRWIGLLGVATAALWLLRNYSVGGETWLAGRLALSSAVDAGALKIGPPPPLPPAVRVYLAATRGTAGVFHAALLDLPLVGVATALHFRKVPAVRAAALYLLGVPFVIHLMAPGIAASGTLFRTAAALSPTACALAAIGLVAIGEWSAKVRGYPRVFLPILLGTATVLIPIIGGILSWSKLDPLPECDVLDGVPKRAPVLSTIPLNIEARCGHPGALIPEKGDVRALAARYDIRHALVGPWGIEEGRLPADLPGWRLLRPGLAEAPESAQERSP